MNSVHRASVARRSFWPVEASATIPPQFDLVKEGPHGQGCDEDRDLAHPRGRLSRMVPAGDQGGRSGRCFSRAGLHGDPAVGLGHLGEYAARPRPAIQRNRPRERLFSALHPAELPAERGPARRGVRQRVCRRHASPPRNEGRQAAARPVGRAGRAPHRAAHERNDHRRHVRQVGAVVPRPADPD